MKKLLFVIESLTCAGAEKSLVTLLNLIDYTKYSVDLQLFSYGGEFEQFLPKEVNLLKPIGYINFTNQSLKNSIISAVKDKKWKFLISRIKFSLSLKLRKQTISQQAISWWEITNSNIEISKKKYDIAISYAQRTPTFYVAEKIIADKKFAWINVDINVIDSEKAFYEYFYDKFNKIVAVSDLTREAVEKSFPKYKENINVIYDINNFNFIKKLSEESLNKEYNFDGLKLLTIGRLAPQKGYSIALEACEILKRNNINLKWYVLGKGEDEFKIRKFIAENKLENNFVLLGVTSNPYPYIDKCDIYVQTSIHEGFGLAIAEARMLNKPVVTTKFDAVFNQMVQEKNGLVVEMNAQAVADGIMRMITDNELRESIIEYLKHEKKGNIEELDKFYDLIEE